MRNSAEDRSVARGRGARRCTSRAAILAAALLAGAAGAQTTRLVSHVAGAPDTAGNGAAAATAALAAGRYVAFESSATDLVAGYSGGGGQIYLWNRDAPTLRLVSHVPGSATAGGAGQSLAPRVSAEGRYVVFTSGAPDLIAGGSDGNALDDVFLWDRLSGDLRLVSRAAGAPATAANGESFASAISADGRYVVFDSTATDLVGAGSDSNASEDVFQWDRATGAVTLVSHVGGGATQTGDGKSRFAVASADGGHVAFVSEATDLIAGAADTNGAPDIFLWSRDSGAVTLVSHAAGAPTTTGDGGCGKPSISADGRFVAFVAEATDLIPGGSDTNGESDAFLWGRESGLVRLVSHVPGSPTTAASGISLPVQVSDDGRWVILFSGAADLVAGVDANGADDAFLWDGDDGSVRLISHAAASGTTAGNGGSRPVALGPEARFVALTSGATDLVTGATDANAANDAFLWERASGSLVLVSRTPAPAATAGNDSSAATAVGGDGRAVVVASLATDLVAGTDLNSGRDLFWRDLSWLFSDGFESGDWTAWSAAVP